ncbi:MAG: TetR/AcrR family transcriptional regulator [Spirochaetota bacterium]
MHVVKEYDERKAEFLDTAMRLFMQHGYEQTSVNAIIDAVGVSKGAFYHYFKTKEDLLDDLAARASEQALALVEPLADDVSLSAVQRLNEMFRRTNSFKAQNRELMIAIARVFYSQGNILLRDRLQTRSVEAVAPLLARIIAAGNDEGTMSVTHPDETARFVLRIGADLVAEFADYLPRIGEHPEVVDAIVRKMEVYTESVERILGMEPGTLVLVDESMMKVIQGERND